MQASTRLQSNADGFIRGHDLTVGRILIASLFLVAGVRKIINWTATMAAFSKFGIPAVEIVLPLVILLELAGGLMLVIGWRVRWVAYVLAAFSLLAGVLGHAFWNADAAQFGNQLNHFLKNVAVCGGLFCLGSLYRRPE